MKIREAVSKWFRDRRIVLDVALFGKSSAPARRIPRGYLRAYRMESRAVDVYAIVPFALGMRAAAWWLRRRWILEHLLFTIGWMEGDHDEMPTFRSLRFGDPRRIIAQRAINARGAGRDAGRYELARAVQDSYAQGYSDAHRTFTKAIEDLRIDVGLLRYRIEHGHDPVPVTPGLAALEGEIERKR